MSKNLSDIFPPTVIGGSGGGIEEAPKTGKIYGRKDEAWQEFEISDIEPGNQDGETLAWSTADAEYMPNDTLMVKGGNVGIGTDSPSAPLQIAKNATTTSDLFQIDTDGTRGLGISLDASSTGRGRNKVVYRSGDAAGEHEFLTGNGQSTLYLNVNGRVGIGGTPGTRSALEIAREAKDTLTRWKSTFDERLKAEPKADKKAVTLEITNDEFSTFPTEETLIERLQRADIGGGNAKLQVAGDGYFSGDVYANGSPLTRATDLIRTLSTLRNATKDETTLEGLRDAIGNAIGGLIEEFEAMQSAVTQEVTSE